MLSRIIAIFTAPVDARALRQYLQPRGPYDHLPDPFWDRLSRHPRRAILRYADWCRDRALRVDLDSGQAWAEPLAAEVFADVIGGIGLASLILLRLCPAGADPLGADNPLIFATSPFVGTGITTASKIAVAARSPQTGMIGDSLSSSYLALAIAMGMVLALTRRRPAGAEAL